MSKKELAFVLGSTGNMAFATANVLMGLKTHFSACNYDTIIYCDNTFSENDVKLINEIINSYCHPALATTLQAKNEPYNDGVLSSDAGSNKCRMEALDLKQQTKLDRSRVIARDDKKVNFIEFKGFDNQNDIFETNTINRFTRLTFSRFECFKLLNAYKKVIWLDIDILIKDNINDIINTENADICLYGANGILKNEFSKPVDEYKMDVMSYNAGVIVLSDSIKEPEKITEWCYEKTLEIADTLKNADQGIINLILQEFDLNFKMLSQKFNCHPDYPESPDAAVLHPFCMEKFWNFYSYREWNENYKKWLKMGGSKYRGKKFNFFEKRYINFKKRYFLEAPDPLRHTRKFIKYLIEEKRNG